jgi:hypothetical protein
MDSSKQINIRQDLQDYLDIMAFDLKVTRRRRKRSQLSSKSCPKKEIKDYA